jgi:hypothetical protein
VDELSTRDLRRLLNLNEITFLFGLWIKNKHKGQKLDIPVNEMSKSVHELMDELHFSFLLNLPKLDSNTTFEDFMLNSTTLQETIFYSGTGTYDYQYAQYFLAKYFLDKAWILSNKGFSAESVLPFFTFFKGILHYKLNVKKIPSDSLDLYKFHKDSFIFEKYPEFRVIIDLLAIKEYQEFNQSFENIGDFNMFKMRPIIEYEDLYILPIPYLVAEAIYENPYYWFLEDINYKNQALSNRGNIAESIVFNALNKRFGNTTVFRNVFVKPNKTKTITELDVCLKHENTLVIFQVKSKKLTQLSKQGNLEQLKKDFDQAVKNAYDQAYVAISPIISNDCQLVNESNKIIIETNGIDDIYVVCIVLDNYPPLGTHSNLFYYGQEITPIAMSIFDLEILIEYLSSPHIFIDYVKKRTLNSKYFIADSELSYLRYYLDNGLERRIDSDLMYLDIDFAQQFDIDFYTQLIKKNEIKIPLLIDGISRNQKCFCGSGIKFKNCCLNLMDSLIMYYKNLENNL